MADDITAKLVLDLGDLRAQLEAVKREQTVAAEKAEVVEKKVVTAKRQVEILEPQVSVIEKKIMAAMRSSIRMGMAGLASGILESLSVDDGLAGSLGRIGSGALFGFLSSGGNPAAAAGVALATTVAEVARGIRDQYKVTDEIRKQVQDLQAKMQENVAELMTAFDNRLQVSADQLRSEARQMFEARDNLLYETSQYAADNT